MCRRGDHRNTKEWRRQTASMDGGLRRKVEQKGIQPYQHIAPPEGEKDKG